MQYISVCQLSYSLGLESVDRLTKACKSHRSRSTVQASFLQINSFYTQKMLEMAQGTLEYIAFVIA
jgi:hypothetical protein